MPKFFSRSDSSVDKFKEEKRGEVAELILNSLDRKAMNLQNRQPGQFYMDDFLSCSFANILYNQTLTGEIMVSKEVKNLAARLSNNGKYSAPLGIKSTTSGVQRATNDFKKYLEETLSEVSEKSSIGSRSNTKPEYLNNIRSLLNDVIDKNHPIAVDNSAEIKRDSERFGRQTRRELESQRKTDDAVAKFQVNAAFAKGRENYEKNKAQRYELGLENRIYRLSADKKKLNDGILDAELSTGKTVGDIVKSVVKHNIRQNQNQKPSNVLAMPEVPDHDINSGKKR